MKKLYILAASLLALSTINAQELTAVSSNSNTATVAKNPAAILYNQATVGTNGIVTDVLSNGNFVATADDFTLTAAANVTKFNINGFQNAATLNTVCTGVMLYVYTDNGGKPSGIPGDANPFVARIDLNAPSTAYTITAATGGLYSFAVDVVAANGTPLLLQANTKYWLVFAPKVNLTAYTAATRFNWLTGTVNTDKAKLVDPQDAFGAGATNWTDISTLTATPAFDGLSFSVEGDNLLGVNGEVYSNIKDVVVTQDANQLLIFAKNQKIKSADIYSTDGKKVLSGSSDKINISSLVKGVYIVNVTTINGKTSSTKFIKK